MKNNKGFVFIETIITIVFLTAALLLIYKNFNNSLIKEKTRVHYDDIAYIYRTYYIKEYFKDNSYEDLFNNILNSLTDEEPIVIIGCEYEGLIETESKRDICRTMMSSTYLEPYIIAVSKADLSYVKGCKNDSTYKCLYLNNFSKEEVEYFKTLGKLGSNDEYVMIIEYRTNVSSSIVDYNYAWIKI